EKIHLLFTCLQLSMLLRKAVMMTINGSSGTSIKASTFYFIIITFSSESIIISPNFVITVL
ncbi:hypothetical protein V1478_000115, partial [Vespula squamosa]